MLRAPCAMFCLSLSLCATRILPAQNPATAHGGNRGASFDVVEASISEIYKGDTFKDLEAKVENMEDALRLAVEFEKSTLNLYYGLKEVLGEHEPLNAVIAEEHKHVVRLFGHLEKIVG